MAIEPQTMNKELQKLYMQMQVLEQQSQQLQKQLQAIDQQVEELESVKKSLDELTGVKPGTEMFVPFAGGIFIKVELKDNKNLLLNVGAGTSITKSIPDTGETIASQIVDMGDLRQKIVAQLDRIIDRAKDVEKEMEKLV